MGGSRGAGFSSMGESARPVKAGTEGAASSAKEGRSSLGTASEACVAMSWSVAGGFCSRSAACSASCV